MRVFALCAGLALAPAAVAQPAAPGKAAAPAKSAAPKPAEVAAHLRERMESILTVLADDQRFDKALRELNTLWDQAIAYAAPGDESLLADVVYSRQLVWHISRADQELRKGTYALLRRQPELGRTLIFLMRRYDRPDNVFAVLQRLHGAHGDAVGQYAALAAALCIVHDNPLLLANRQGEADPVELFAYFARNESRLAFGLQPLPGEILVYMVNSRASITEMEWALAKHAGDRNVGKRFHDLVYDTASLKYNKPKRIEGHPYTLENLRKFGGTCADQAYFAAQVGKAIGVPTAEISGKGSDLGHAWVGFLQRRGSTWVFNCDEGVFGEYEKLRAVTSDPQSGRMITQSQVELLMGLADSKPADRFAAAALIESARRLRSTASGKNPKWPPAFDLAGAAPTRATLEPRVQLAMLERAASLVPASPEVWMAAVEWAADMTAGERDAWFRALNKASEHATPDFAYAITCELIGATSDRTQQLAAWEWLRKQYPRRPDLACGALQRKADLLLSTGDKNAALEAHSEAAKTYCNNGPLFLASLDKADGMLREINRLDLLAGLYGDVFRRTSKPGTLSDGKMAASNFYRVGERYAGVLQELGRTRDAEQVRRQIKAPPPAP